MTESLVWGQQLQKAEVQKAVCLHTRGHITAPHPPHLRSRLPPPSTLCQCLQHAGPGRELPQLHGLSWMPEQEMGSLSQALAVVTHSHASDG